MSSGKAMGRFELPQQCKGITRRGSRCSINSAKAVIGNEGHDLAAPLRAGCSYCRAHLPSLVAKPCAVEDALIFFLDFETSGLDIFSDHIVEFGLLCENGECFSTVCCPPVMTPGPHVHGISNEELCLGPPFVIAFARMVHFIECLLLVSIDSEDESSEDGELPTTRFKEQVEVILVAHNGYKFDFPFLLSECQRNCLDWAKVVADWKLVDTLDVVKSIDAEVYGGCQKLQCLLQKTDCCNLQAHRALDDCRALQAVVQHLAEYHGVSAWRLLRRFLFSVDVLSTHAHLTVLCAVVLVQGTMSRQKYTLERLDGAAKDAQEREEKNLSEMITTLLGTQKESLGSQGVKICCKVAPNSDGRLKGTTQIPFAWSFTGYGYEHSGDQIFVSDARQEMSSHF